MSAHHPVNGGVGGQCVHTHTQLLLYDKGMAADQFGGEHSAVTMETSKRGHLEGPLFQVIDTGAGCFMQRCRYDIHTHL